MVITIMYMMRDVSHTKSERWAQVNVFPHSDAFFFVENHVIAPYNRPLIIRVFPQVLSYTDLLCFISIIVTPGMIDGHIWTMSNAEGNEGLCKSTKIRISGATVCTSRGARQSRSSPNVVSLNSTKA